MLQVVTVIETPNNTGFILYKLAPTMYPNAYELIANDAVSTKTNIVHT